VFVSQSNLAAFNVAGYNPELDPDGQGARKLIDLLADVLAARLETESSVVATEVAAVAAAAHKVAEPAPADIPATEIESADVAAESTTEDPPEPSEPDSVSS
jgi:hypothetical protein